MVNKKNDDGKEVKLTKAGSNIKEQKQVENLKNKFDELFA